MDEIARNCSWADEQLTSDQELLEEIPTELLARVQTEADTRYLDAIASAFLIPKCTDRLFCLYEPLAVDAFGRLCLERDSDDNTQVAVISAVARVLPFAPYLKTFLFASVDSQQRGPLTLLSETRNLKLGDLSETTLIPLLLAVFRLLSHDVEAFRHVASPIQIFSLFTHRVEVVRYLAIRCFSIYMQFADAKIESLLEKHLGTDPIVHAWDGRTIDYRYLSLWEERRWHNFKVKLEDARSSRSNRTQEVTRQLSTTTLSSQAALLGSVLVPRPHSSTVESSKLVPTPTTEANLSRFASALLDSKPILLQGPPGSGKTSVVNDAASALGASSSLLTLHLNEQTDSKGLVGIYTASAGTFKWQAGILTKAVREGRWVLIEDIDRAPQEVLGLLLPLIEQGELSIPSRKERIRAAQGFRILGTIRSHVNARGEETSAFSAMLGARLWQVVKVEAMPIGEIETLLKEKYPLLQQYTPSILATYQRLQAINTGSSSIRSVRSRKMGLRDLMKWCARIARTLEIHGVRNSQDPISENVSDGIFLGAVDCFIRYLPDQAARVEAATSIAQEMQLSPQRMKFMLHDRLPEVKETGSSLVVGREFLSKTNSRTVPESTFAWTHHAARLIETCAAGIQMAEPLLLVGETGIGKTTAIQYLARKLGKRLVVINLSQQSESSDMLGGFKPVTMRSIALPMVEEFEDLFDQTFSAKRNQKFMASIMSCVKKQNYQRLTALWEEAVKMAENNLEIKPPGTTTESQKPAKRRRIEGTKYEHLRTRWVAFSSQLSNLRASVSKESDKFAFAFVEGKVVQALKNGDWVLLDEINLAAPDTLESVVGLLSHGDDGRPTALLSESGQAEKIVGHKDFRIFGAMNPATDSGKRDLAPGVRSRFTEIYVEAPDRDLPDLLTLIEAYVGDLTVSDKRLGTDLAQLYLAVQDMSDKRQLTDGAGTLPHFSIRTLVRTLLYLRKHVGVYGLRRAAYEGFSMSFLTMLGKDSELALMPLLESHLLSSQKNARSLLRQAPRPPKEGTEYVQFRHYWVAKGAQEALKEAHYIITPFVERNLLNLARAVSMRTFPVLLQGPTSSGKTSMVEYLAKISGHKFVRINNHEHTDLQEYLGSYTSDEEGRLRYKEGVLVQALRQGHWVVLDELNLAPTDVLEALNRLLDDNRELFIPETQETIRPHSDFMLFATQNPAGVYGGRKHLSRAFRNRFLELHFDDIPEDELEFIIKERAQIAPSFCTKIVSVYKKLSLMRQSSRLFEQRNSFATLRDLFRWALRKADDREQLALHGFMLLGERIRDAAEKQAVKTIIEEVMKVKIDERSLYSQNVLPQSAASPPSGIIWTPATVRLAVLIIKAIENNEPVLLIGETGGGKTQVFQTVSHMLGKSLQILNAHVNLETGDLIGAQRPIRNRAAIEEKLTQDLQVYFSSDDVPATVSLEDMITEFRKRVAASKEPEIQELIERIRGNIVRRQALFEWTDGSLVSAMKAGNHFLLDEIALADDSVLERLNSVLEPSRTILLAEKGADKASVTAYPGFQFFATMNPGGDYGKRELSAALRNRLTEIWVPALTDEDIAPILQQRLALTDSSFPRLMLQFSKWFRQSFSRSTDAHVSLRELLSWVDFVQANPALDLSVSVAHGAAMVYIDGLGANPATSMSVTEEDLPIARQQCIYKLSELLKVDATTILGLTPNVTLSGDRLEVGHFSVLSVSGLGKDPDFAFDAPTTRRNAMRVIRAMQLDKPILLEGNPGVGKTTLVAALARATGHNLTRINLSEQTDLMDMFGSDVPVEGEAAGQFAWRDGPFLRAMQAGEWVLLDEMNLASQSVLEGLNACLDHRKQVYVAELDQTFHRHPNFMLFAAQNPHHQGGGRKGLPASFVNRFSIVYADMLDEEDLSIITAQLHPNLPKQFLNEVISVTSQVIDVLQADRRLNASGGPWDVNLRDIYRWLQLCHKKDLIINPANFANLILTQRFRTQEQRSTIGSIIDNFFGNRTKTKSLFQNLSRDIVQVGQAFVDRDVDFRRVEVSGLCLDAQVLPIYEGLMHCINNSWPAILVGSSGCGKTRCIRDLAALAGANVVEFALNGDTDSMDLVGGFEQIDPRRELSHRIDSLIGLLSEHIARSTKQVADPSITDRLLSAICCLQGSETHFNKLPTFLLQDERLRPTYEAELQMLAQAIVASRATERPSFAWADGILVQAMEQGSWVVLNNANLCNPSVLDRLNSLMEPNGHLVLNEQHTTDGSPRIVIPHPKFRVFLTVDPRYGELSKAMRNRCVELHMGQLNVEAGVALSSPYYGDESRIKRIRLSDLAHESSDTHDNDASFKQYMARIALNHMSPSDLATTMDSPEYVFAASAFERTFDDYKQLYFGQDDVATQLITRTYGPPSAVLQADTHEFLATQPVYPGINEPLLSFQPDEVVRLANKTATLADLFLDLIHTFGVFQALKDEVTQKKTTDFSMLQRSIAAARLPGQPNRPISAVSRFFQQTLELVLSWLKVTLKNAVKGQMERAIISSATDIVRWLLDFVNLTSGHDVAAANIQVYLQIGLFQVQQLANLDSAMSVNLGQALRVFDSDWKLRYGRSLARMWPTWKPWTPETEMHLALILRLRDLVRHFDVITRHLYISTNELGRLRLALENTAQLQLKSTAALGDFLEDFEPTLVELEKSIESQKKSRSNLFQASFEALLQHFDLESVKRTVLTDNVLLIKMAILAKRPTTMALHAPKDSPMATLDRLMGFAGQTTGTGSLALNGHMLISLAEQTAKLSEVPLSEVNSAQDSLKTLMQSLATLPAIIGTDKRSLLKDACSSLLKYIFACHLDLLSPSVVSSLFEDGATIDLDSLENRLFVDSCRDLHFRDIYRRYLIHAIRYTIRGPADFGALGRALFNISMAILHLIVPDRPYDPALELIVTRDRHGRHSAELRSRLAAVLTFEKAFTGQSSNLQSRSIDDQLAELGGDPPAPAVVRPVGQEFQALQTEFDVIIQNVISKGSDDLILSETHSQQKQNEMRLLQQNVLQLTSRLSSCSAAFDDLTIPVIRALQCLAFSTDLISLQDPHNDRAASLVRSLSTETPLLGGRPLDHDPKVEVHNQKGSRQHNLRLHELQRHTVWQPIRHDTKWNVLLVLFQSFYEEWKVRLSTEQVAEENRSRYYEYRGGDPEDQDSEDAELRTMFPTYDEESPDTSSEDKTKDVPKTTAVRLAQLQASLSQQQPSDIDLGKHLRASLEAITAAASFGKDKLSPLYPTIALPAILLRLDQEFEASQASVQQARTDFYLDHNTAEVHAILELLQKITTRFRSIHDAWPEHTTPQDVLTCCTEILAFKKVDPLAKIITKVEKLHGFVNEWQAVASKQYSVSDLSQAITDLIIRWRRLELLSWPNLLDKELQKCSDDAQGWWFITYEVLVAIPLQFVEESTDLSVHCNDLADSLTKFMQTTSMGQFAIRLNLLCHFDSLLLNLSEQHDQMRLVRNTVLNIVEHFERFRDHVDKVLEDGRSKFEKDVKEQIQLASWKDTNVTALRDSAKRSHFKLFKVVKKYRTFLAKPFDIPGDVGPKLADEEDTPDMSLGLVPMRLDEEMLLEQYLARTLETWTERPERLRKPSQAAQSMQRLYRSVESEFDSPGELRSFREMLVTTISSLRKQTPSTLTEDNKNAVQHLKTQKRKLLADTIKDVRQMGISRNLATEEIDRQRTLPLILATTPATDLGDASQSFHGLLDMLPTILQAAQEYSDDLNGSEVGRCIGSIQGLIFLMRKQRDTLIPAMVDSDAFSIILEKIKALRSGPSGQVCKVKIAQGAILSQRLLQLHEILKVSTQVIRVQSKHSGSNFGAVIGGIEEYMSALDAQRQLIDEVIPMPSHLSTNDAESIYTDTSLKLDALQASLTRWTQDYSNLSHLLNQVIPWTNLAIEETAPSMNGAASVPIKDVDSAITSAADAIFVALQRFATASASPPANTDEAGWLSKADNHMRASIKALAVRDATIRLEAAVDTLTRCRDTDLESAVTIAKMLLPIFEQYQAIHAAEIQRYRSLHQEVCAISYVLGKAFTRLAAEGFCSPAEAGGDKDDSGNVESGTGLGDGDGAEDISKDVGDDEDLSEFAQQQNEKEEGGEVDAAEDAVDMGADDLEGNMDETGEAKDTESGDEPEGDEPEADMDEEAGDVDNLDPSAVDEKMWEGLGKEDEKELEDDKAKGQEDDDETAAAKDKKGRVDEKKEPEEAAGSDDEDGMSSADEEGEAVGREEPDQTDPHLEQEQAMDLPEEMQLDGEKDGPESEIDDEDFDKLSDVEEPAQKQDDELPPDEGQDEQDADADADMDNTEADAAPEEGDEANAPDQDEVMDDPAQDEGLEEDAEHLEREEEDADAAEPKDAAAAESGVGGEADEEETSNKKAASGETTQEAQDIEQQSGADDMQSVDQSGEGKRETSKEGAQQPDAPSEQQVEAFRKLGDMLEKWHRREREILQATEEEDKDAGQINDTDMADAEFEHLQNEEDTADTQALGSATKDQARALDQEQAFEDAQTATDEQHPPADAEQQDPELDNVLEDTPLQMDPTTTSAQQPASGPSVPDKTTTTSDMGTEALTDELDPEQIPDVSTIDLDASNLSVRTDPEQASRLWQHYSSLVHPLSLTLTEQLRLILSPTLASKLRGDYRTGKRLNIKRIIPYIASNYKRDKIWLRRSIPSKRNYQILLAVDDSKSMAESGSGLLALETVALLCKSLSMLEVGEISVVSFGNEDHIRLAHPFGTPFTNDAGPKVFQNFSYAQNGTNVKKLVEESIALFRDARSKNTGSNAADLWQLMMIISDGICEDHAHIQRLVRQAREERIMIVFVIVDPQTQTPTAGGPSTTTSSTSILDLTSASFEPDTSPTGTGEMKLKIKRYLESFPFPYYLIVRDIRELPGVLGTALKGWFSEVVESS